VARRPSLGESAAEFRLSTTLRSYSCSREEFKFSGESRLLEAPTEITAADLTVSPRPIPSYLQAIRFSTADFRAMRLLMIKLGYGSLHSAK
jgi:hypothetical protein